MSINTRIYLQYTENYSASPYSTTYIILIIKKGEKGVENPSFYKTETSTTNKILQHNRNLIKKTIVSCCICCLVNCDYAFSLSITYQACSTSGHGRNLPMLCGENIQLGNSNELSDTSCDSRFTGRLFISFYGL